MNNVKRIAALVLCLIMVCCLCAVFASCEAIDLQHQIKELKKANEQLASRVEELKLQLYNGKFYTLSEAYDKGLLTSQDLQVVSDYYSGVKTNKEVLDDNVARTITRAFARRYGRETTYMVYQYYGTYNHCVVVDFYDANGIYDPMHMYDKQEIGGVVFNIDLYAPPVYVWTIGA